MNLKKPFKIPTLPTLTFLISSLLIGLLLLPKSSSKGNVLSESTFSSSPENIQVANVTHQKATIIWETKEKTHATIIWGKDNDLKNIALDDREIDQNVQFIGRTHFVTLNDLNINSEYSFMIKQGQFTFPDKPLKFKTAKKDISTKYPSLTGKILSQNLQTSQDTLVILKSPNTQPLASYTLIKGDFLISLFKIYKTNLSEPFPIIKNSPITLEATNGIQRSTTSITIPYTQPLPAIILGNNYDYTSQTTQQNSNKFDLNDDRKVNSFDLAILINNIDTYQVCNKSTNKNPSCQIEDLIKKYDLNLDKMLDGKDINSLKEKLISP